jgi:hypothetical protein
MEHSFRHNNNTSKQQSQLCSETYASHGCRDGKLYLEVRQFDGSYAFAQLEDDKVQLVPEIVAGDITLRPRPLPTSENRAVVVVGMPDENIVFADLLPADVLYRELESHFRKYIDLPDLDLELCIYYTIFTWLYEKVNTVGYLRFLADTGKGKSRILQVVGDLCFYPLSASGASSFSGVARQQLPRRQGGTVRKVSKPRLRKREALRPQ